MIQQFESHPNKEFFLQDLNKTEDTNEFSEKSQKLIADVNNTEIFELCENSSKKHCPECAFYCEIGIVNCICGRCLKSSRRTQELDKNNCDVLSIPGYVIKKNTIRGAKHGPSERQRMCFKAMEMLQQACQPKHGSSKSILEMAQRRQIPKFFVTHRVDRGANY